MTNDLYEFKKTLRDKFMSNVAEEYSHKHMSMNLVKSMRRRTIKRHGIVSVYIYAPEYDIWKWWYDRVIVDLHTGSYAEDNDAGSGGLRPIPKGKKVKSDWRRIPASNNYGSLRLQATHNHNEFVERNMVAAIHSTLGNNKGITYKIKLRGR